MADDHKFLYDLEQNPAPVRERGQDFQNAVQAQSDAVMAAFMKVLPSNYVAQVTGPFYTLQFQSLAEEVARIQVGAQEAFKDSDFDFTRTEFLWEIIGTFVFPRTTEGGDKTGWPQVEGDITYREFLQNMVLLLIQGATKDNVQTGAGLLTEADVTVIEKVATSHLKGSAWGLNDQFTFEVNVEYQNGTAWPPEDPIVLQDNVRIILQALKPAHTLYEYRHVFREAFNDVFSDSSTWFLDYDYYEDFRKFCYGALEVTGTAGATLTDRTCFTDVTREFDAISAGAKLTITTGNNARVYEVKEVRSMLVGTDTTERAYTTSPTGLSGDATVADDVITDLTQDFGSVVEGEVLTLATGPNAGAYRLETLLGATGGPVGEVSGPATAVRVSPCILKLTRRMPEVATGQSYMVEVDRLGVRVPKTITGEDAAAQFYL